MPWCAHKVSSGDIIVVLASVCCNTCRTKQFPCDAFLRMCLVIQCDYSYTEGQGVFSLFRSLPVTLPSQYSHIACLE